MKNSNPIHWLQSVLKQSIFAMALGGLLGAVPTVSATGLEVKVSRNSSGTSSDDGVSTAANEHNVNTNADLGNTAKTAITGTLSGFDMTSGTPVMPVTNGLVCWYDAALGVTVNGSGVISTWNDQSGNGHTATTGSGTPTLAVADINSKPAVHIRGTGTYLDCAGSFFTKEQYLVVRSPNPLWSGNGCFLGRNVGRTSSYNLMVGTTGFWQDQVPTGVSKNGIGPSGTPPTTVLNWANHDKTGNAVNGCHYALDTITNYMILKITVQGNAVKAVYRIGKNDNLGSCDMDIAEILGYTSALSASDEAKVGAYLTKKYGLSTAYPGATFSSTALSLTGGSTPSAVGSALTFTAAVGGITPTGVVTFYDGATSLGTGTLNGSSQASFTTRSLNVGTHHITAQYAGDVGNATSVSEILAVKVATLNDILSFTFPGLPASTVTGTTINVTVPYATNLSALAPTYTLLSGSTGAPVSGNARNFSTPQTYVINGTKTYTVTVSKVAASSTKDILACDFGALGAATINGTGIVLTVPPTQLRSLAPTFTISPLATLSPLSGSTQDFTNPVTYTVSGQDGSIKSYTVTVETYNSWSHHGALFILTTPEGANLTASASETNFPLLVRLTANNFNFADAQSDGRDIRFSTAAGAPLFYQIEQWDATNSLGAVWVKIPLITGNARQKIEMHWGRAGVFSESNGIGVFNAANGFASVFHMNETVSDVVGTVTATDSGTTLGTGMIGKDRNFTAGNGIQCGDNITAYPLGSTPHTTEAWIRPVVASTHVLGWGVEQGSSRVVMQVTGLQAVKPPHMSVDTYGGCNVTGASFNALSQWLHVAYTYHNGVGSIYVNGQLDGTNLSGALDISTPSSLYLGGWIGAYNYVGAMDEVRISKVARSADWIKLEYENQKPLQTLVGTLVQVGSTFAASPVSVTMKESTSTTLTGQAGGAQKVYWIEKKNGVETLLATDQLTFNLSVGRATGDQNYVIEFQGIYPDSVQTIDVPVTIKDTIPDPVFTLTAPATWNGRDTITVTPKISNLSAMQAAGAGNLNYSWNVNGVAVIKQITPAVLTLLRSQGSGPMIVSLTMDNGGGPITVSKTITVQEPPSDPWLVRPPLANEKPVNNQFYARDPSSGFGTIYYTGTQAAPASSVYLKVYTTDTGSDVPYGNPIYQTLVDGSYSFAVPIAAGKVTYKITYGTRSGGVDSAPLATVSNLLCGDAFMIEGQSNALAVDNAAPNDPTTNPWIRSYGLSSGWGGAISKGSDLQLGLWGWDLANRLSSGDNMPICIINAAVGGTRIDQHMPNPAGHGTPGSLYSIYANLYNRLVAANLTYGIRGVLWHQGEQDQGSGGLDGDYDYKFYQQYFVDMTAAWKQDFPNIQNYYVFQIWPAACGDTSRNDQLREVQRDLSGLYSKMRLMSTLGIVPGSSCHYDAAGYQVFSDLIGPLIEQDVYGLYTSSVYTAANLKRAYFTTALKNEIALEFDQQMSWNTDAPGLFFLDGVAGKVKSGSASGKVITLELNAPSSASAITYLQGLVSWSQPKILYGSNGIAALTFADVPIGTSSSP